MKPTLPCLILLALCHAIAVPARAAKTEIHRYQSMPRPPLDLQPCKTLAPYALAHRAEFAPYSEQAPTWEAVKIVPSDPGAAGLTLDRAIQPKSRQQIAASSRVKSAVYQYAQTMLEGVGARLTHDGRYLRFFRLADHLRRMSGSAHGLAMPQLLPAEELVAAIAEMMRLNLPWITEALSERPGWFVYLRPNLAGIGDAIMDHDSGEFAFTVVASLSPSSYDAGNDPLQRSLSLVMARNNAMRAKPGQAAVKCGGNYSGVFEEEAWANANGYDQVLFATADGTAITETGVSSFFVVDGNSALHTPTLAGRELLAGITRNSLITLAGSMGLKVQERKIGIDELFDGVRDGRFSAIFLSGTAIRMARVGTLARGEQRLTVGDPQRVHPVVQQLYQALDAIQTGQRDPDPEWAWPILDLPVAD